MKDAVETEVVALDKRKYVAWNVDHQPYHILMEDAIANYIKLKYVSSEDDAAVDDGYGTPIKDMNPTDQIIIVQQKGLNRDMTLGAKGSERYARLMINTLTFTDSGVKLFCESSPLTATDLILGNTEIKKQYDEILIEWMPIEFKKINEMCVLHISFIRSGFNGNVKVDEYSFFNNDLQHNLILSYRVNEEDYWKQDFEKILNSFTITNIR